MSKFLRFGFGLILILMGACSVKVPQHIKDGFTYCYNQESTGIERIINNNGFFSYSKEFDAYRIGSIKVHKIDTMFYNLMFFDDGIFIIGFHDSSNKNSQDKIPGFFKKIVLNPMGEEAQSFSVSYEWGIYRIEGDVIKTQFVNHPAPPPVWSAFEIWYKVLDRNTIIEIFSKPIHYTKEVDRNNYEITRSQKVISPYKFFPVEVKPTSNCWLKNEDWFYCDGTVPH